MIIKIEKEKLYGLTPPFCRLASINVGKYFLKLIDKHFKHDNIVPYHNDSIIVKTDARRKIDAWRKDAGMKDAWRKDARRLL